MINLRMEELAEIVKVIISSSIFFVWVVRYSNIIEEFRLFRYPAWLRDLVGILKLSFAFMIHSSHASLIVLGSSGIIILMLMALFTHIRIRNKLTKALPSLSLLVLSFFILL